MLFHYGGDHFGTKRIVTSYLWYPHINQLVFAAESGLTWPCPEFFMISVWLILWFFILHFFCHTFFRNINHLIHHDTNINKDINKNESIFPTTYGNSTLTAILDLYVQNRHHVYKAVVYRCHFISLYNLIIVHDHAAGKSLKSYHVQIYS